MKQMVLSKCDHHRIFVNIWNLASCTGSIYIQAEFELEILHILNFIYNVFVCWKTAQGQTDREHDDMRCTALQLMLR
jgi:hypothetical protein